MDPGSLVRIEVMKGWSQVQKLQNKLKLVPLAGGYEDHRSALVDETARIISTFTNVIAYLNHQSTVNNSSSKDCSSAPPSPLSPSEETGIPPANSSKASAAPVSGSDCSQSDEDPSPNTKKRKAVIAKQQGDEIVPEDGYNWRKYGQKDILGSRHPKSYYRCTHKRESGCPAIKYVQRSDSDPTSFHITYRGEHNCQNLQVLRYPHQQHHLQQQSFPLNSACLRINSDGGLQLTPSGPTLRSLLSSQQQQLPFVDEAKPQIGRNESEVVAEHTPLSVFDLDSMLENDSDHVDCLDLGFQFEQPLSFCTAAD